jgi:hypothetical protein
MSERISLKIDAPEWRAVTEADLSKLRLLVQLPSLALKYINACTAELDDAHRKGWRPDAVTIREVMHVKRHRETLSRGNDGFIFASLVLDRAKANMDAWKRRTGKKVRV